MREGRRSGLNFPPARYCTADDHFSRDARLAAVSLRTRGQMDQKPKAEEISKLGKYALVAEIARGGMGVVYLGMAQGPAGFSKLVAIKALKREFFEDPTFLEMFHNEARLAARVHHPNV